MIRKPTRSDNQTGTKVASLNPELQFRCLIAAASTASRALDSLNRSRVMQKRNPGRGNAGVSQIGDLSWGDIANPTASKHIVNCYATTTIDDTASSEMLSGRWPSPARLSISHNLTGQRGIRELSCCTIIDHVVQLSAAARQLPVVELINLVGSQYNGSTDDRKCYHFFVQIYLWILGQCNRVIVFVQPSRIASPMLH